MFEMFQRNKSIPDVSQKTIFQSMLRRKNMFSIQEITAVDQSCDKVEESYIKPMKYEHFGFQAKFKVCRRSCISVHFMVLEYKLVLIKKKKCETPNVTPINSSVHIHCTVLTITKPRLLYKLLQ